MDKARRLWHGAHRKMTRKADAENGVRGGVSPQACVVVPLLSADWPAQWTGAMSTHNGKRLHRYNRALGVTAMAASRKTRMPPLVTVANHTRARFPP